MFAGDEFISADDSAKSGNWIKIHRKIFEWEWWDDIKTTHVFLTLLLLANHDAGSWHGVPIERGQLITGRLSLAKKTGLSLQEVRTCLTKLKSTNEITIRATNKYSVITITNYNGYQKRKGKQQPAKQPTSHSTGNFPSTTNKKDKELKEGGSPPEKVPEPPMPEDLVLEVTPKVFMKKSEIDRIVKHVGRDAFRFYARKLSDTCARDGKTYKDYAAALRNWIRDDIVKGWGWYTNHPKPLTGYKETNQRPKPKPAPKPEPEIEKASKMKPEEVRRLIREKFPAMKFDDSQNEPASDKVTP